MIKILAKFNHLKHHPSDFVIEFIKKHYQDFSRNMKILDLGCGHLRNSRLFYEKLKMKNITAVDWQDPLPKFDLLKTEIEFRKHDLTQSLPFENLYSDITLLNYVFMFIAPEYQMKLLDEISRVSNKYIVFETYSIHDSALRSQNGTDFKSFTFESVVEYFDSRDDFQILILKNHSEKLLVERVANGKG